MTQRSEYQDYKKTLTPRAVASELGFSIDHPPMRVKQLDNPFHESNASTDHLTVSSRFFLLNDRNRIKLTQSVASEQQSEEDEVRKIGRIKRTQRHSQSQQNMRLPSSDQPISNELSRNNQQHRAKLKNQMTKNSSIQQKHDSNRINRFATFHEQNFTSYQQAQKHQQSTIRKQERTSTIKQQQYKYSIERKFQCEQKQQISKFTLPKSYENCIQQGAQKKLTEEEQPLDQDIDEDTYKQKQIAIKLIPCVSNLPQLSQASRVSSNFERQQQKSMHQSFIQKIQEKSVFVKSQVIQNNHQQNFQQVKHKVRKRIFDYSKKPQNQYQHSFLNKKPSPRSMNRHRPHIFFQHRYLNQNQKKKVDKVSHQHLQEAQPNPQFRQCPHALCTLKSYQIIEKLIDQNRGKLNYQKKKISESKQKMYQTICRSLFQTSVELQTIITKVKLSQLGNENVKKQIQGIRSQIDRLMVKIRQQEYFFNQPQIGREQIENPLSTLKLMHQRLNCLQLVQQRYLMWKFKLQKLSERISNMFECEYENKIGNLKLISEYISELKQSKIYTQEIKQKSWPLFVMYNQYLENEINQLEQTLEWSKQCIHKIEYGNLQ